jgi:hypothetical protein
LMLFMSWGAVAHGRAGGCAGRGGGCRRAAALRRNRGGLYGDRLGGVAVVGRCCARLPEKVTAVVRDRRRLSDVTRARSNWETTFRHEQYERLERCWKRKELDCYGG